MNTVHGLMLAGRLGETGDGWIAMLERWATTGFHAGLTALVVIVMAQKVSLKAGLGALLLMIIALGLYASREDLANMFEDEVKNPSNSAPAVPGIVQGGPTAGREHSAGVGGWL